uniref:Uncharacterized protein n=1 Tax=Daphnia galeata TaxID=27404 RepID=A0A8J2RWW1_9CRUS|nr:unnamed protein product [Daphnia galeata]
MRLVRFKDQGMSSPYLERRDMLRGDLRENRDMMHYPGGSALAENQQHRDNIVDCGHIKIFAMAYVQETKRSWSEEDDFQLEKSKLDVQVRGNSQIGQDRFATFSFMNPISVTLTECEFTIEGPGLVRAQTVKYRDGKPGEMISFASSFRDSAVSANWSHLSIPANWVTLSALARFMSVTEASSSNPVDPPEKN